MTFSTTKPKEDGFYWYKENETSTPLIVEYDHQTTWCMSCGNDIPMHNDNWTEPPDGFYSEKLLP